MRLRTLGGGQTGPGSDASYYLPWGSGRQATRRIRMKTSSFEERPGSDRAVLFAADLIWLLPVAPPGATFAVIGADTAPVGVVAVSVLVELRRILDLVFRPVDVDLFLVAIDTADHPSR